MNQIEGLLTSCITYGWEPYHGINATILYGSNGFLQSMPSIIFNSALKVNLYNNPTAR